MKNLKIKINRNLKSIAKLGFTLLCTTLLLWSCHKPDKDGYDPITTSGGTLFENSAMVNATIHGQALQEDGTPLAGATVKTGTYTTITDNTGFFIFAKINTPKNASLITISKIGFYNGNRTISVTDKSIQKVEIKVLKLESPTAISATLGGVAVAVGGGSVTIAPSSIINKATKLPYTGTMAVFAKRINPSDVDLIEKTPGSLRAINVSGEEKLLSTYGMIGVEMFDANGNALQIAEGKTAKINLPLDGTWANDAPAAIPLWHFSEITGMWMQEGEATKIGNSYEGNVSHFSFWNCDVPNNYVTLEATFVDQNGFALNNYQIKITEQSSNVDRSGFTNFLGYVVGKVPNSSNLLLEVIDICNGSTVLYTQSLAGSATNINLGTIVLPISLSNYNTITGTVYDCSNNPIPNALVKLILPNNNYIVITANSSGVYTVGTSFCTYPQNINIQGYDINNLETGTAVAISLTANGTVVSNLTACGVILGFFNYSINDNGVISNYSHTEASSIISQLYSSNITHFNVFNTQIGNAEKLYLATNGPQTIAGLHDIVSLTYSSNTSSDSAYNLINTPITYTAYGTVGGWIEGNFSTPALTWVSGATNKSVSGNFRVKRTQ